MYMLGSRDQEDALVYIRDTLGLDREQITVLNMLECSF